MHAFEFDQVDTYTTWRIKLARISYFGRIRNFSWLISFSFFPANSSFADRRFSAETPFYEPASQSMPNSNAVCCSKVAKLFDCYRAGRPASLLREAYIYQNRWISGKFPNAGRRTPAPFSEKMLRFFFKTGPNRTNFWRFSGKSWPKLAF